MDLIFPPVCGICGKLNEEWICKKCEIVLKSHIDFKIDRKYLFNHIYFFKYESLVRKLILDFKFKEKSYLYKTFVTFLLKDKKFFDFLNSYDTIIPVPVSRKRRRERGYNQCELIAKELVKQFNSKHKESGLILEYNQKSLVKIINTVKQSELTKEDRKNNAKDVYCIQNSRKLENRRILLIDDIYTTGSTAEECVRTLKKANVKNVDVFTIAKDFLE